MSVYDVVLPTPIPDKGRILTALSLWWFDQLADLVPNHVLSATDVPAEFAGRAIRCRRLEMVAVECIARGYLTGSGLKEYTQTGTVCGIPLPPGLADGSRLPEPIFTPTTKAALGEHDEAMTFDEVVGEVGAEHRRGAAKAHARGLPPGRRARRRARNHHRRHQDRDRARTRRDAGARGRGTDARLLAVLAGRDLGAGTAAVRVRQAVRPRLGGRQRLGQDTARPGRSRRRRRGDPAALHRGLRAPHRGGANGNAGREDSPCTRSRSRARRTRRADLGRGARSRARPGRGDRRRSRRARSTAPTCCSGGTTRRRRAPRRTPGWSARAGSARSARG